MLSLAQQTLEALLVARENARAVLLEQDVHACSHQLGNQEVVAVRRIGQHHVVQAQSAQYLAHQFKLPNALATMWPDGRIQRRACGLADHHDQARQRGPRA